MGQSLQRKMQLGTRWTVLANPSAPKRSTSYRTAPPLCLYAYTCKYLLLLSLSFPSLPSCYPPFILSPPLLSPVIQSFQTAIFFSLHEKRREGLPSPTLTQFLTGHRRHFPRRQSPKGPAQSAAAVQFLLGPQQQQNRIRTGFRCRPRSRLGT